MMWSLGLGRNDGISTCTRAGGGIGAASGALFDLGIEFAGGFRGPFGGVLRGPFGGTFRIGSMVILGSGVGST
jgi:hypothetical protein